MTLCDVTPFSVQILHQLPEGGGEPVSPSSEGFLWAAAGHNDGEWSNRAEDEGRRRRYRETTNRQAPGYYYYLNKRSC